MPVDPDVVADVSDLPEWELVFRFTSGRLCLSFCATVGERWRRNFERLRTTEDVSRWLMQAGLNPSAHAAVRPGLLLDARELREAIYRLVRSAMSGQTGSEADREVLNAWARHAPVSPQLGANQERELWTGPHPAAAGIATVAVDAVDLLTSPAIHRVRECAAGDCALLFLDASRPGQRRWCADNACGSRARSAAYRARQPRPERRQSSLPA